MFLYKYHRRRSPEWIWDSHWIYLFHANVSLYSLIIWYMSQPLNERDHLPKLFVEQRGSIKYKCNSIFPRSRRYIVWQKTSVEANESNMFGRGSAVERVEANESKKKSIFNNNSVWRTVFNHCIEYSESVNILSFQVLVSIYLSVCSGSIVIFGIYLSVCSGPCMKKWALCEKVFKTGF